MAPSSVDVVLLTPHPADVEVMTSAFSRTQVRLHHASTVPQALGLLETTQSLVLVVEDEFSDGDWVQMLDLLAVRHPLVAMVVCSQRADERLWAEVINRGAFDLVNRPFYGPELIRILETAHSYALNIAGRSLGAAG